MAASASQGEDWKIVTSPNRGTGDNNLSCIAAISARDGWAAGFSSNNAGPYQTLIEHWNSTAWKLPAARAPARVSIICMGW
ncbi:MAG TPA: hypothetical protein VEI53_10995 [Ktedonobacteraceae bacterium]|nr:hypothetical protein [Ktedonobacteraceae bacterium]